MDLNSIQALKDEINPHLPQDYEIKCLIAEGSMGAIYSAVNRKNGFFIALKTVKTKGNSSIKSKIAQEFSIQKELKHKNIGHVFGSKETGVYTIICMELLTGGDLFDLIPVGKGINMLRGFQIYAELLDAVEFCHSSNIVHMDIKPENVMLSHRGQVKLIDFGLAVNHSHQPVICGYLGTMAYSAPETFTVPEYTGYKADLFSLNITFLTIITGERCWSKARLDDSNYKDWYERSWTIDVFQRLPTDLLSFLVLALSHDPQQRLSIDQIRAHHWFKVGAKSRMKTLKSPNKKSAINDVPKSQPLLTNVEELLKCFDIPLSQPVDLSSILMPAADKDGQIVKRMSRFFSKKNVAETLNILAIVIGQNEVCTIVNISPNCITVEAKSSGFNVTFRVFVYLFDNVTLVDLRRIKGDGLLFRTVFVNIKKTVIQLGLESKNVNYLKKVQPSA